MGRVGCGRINGEAPRKPQEPRLWRGWCLDTPQEFASLYARSGGICTYLSGGLPNRVPAPTSVGICLMKSGRRWALKSVTLTRSTSSPSLARRDYRKKYRTDGVAIGGQWTKGTGTPGSADISATIKGRSVKIEVKYNKDRQSDAQKQYQEMIEKAGGVYIIAKTFDDFVIWYESFSLHL